MMGVTTTTVAVRRSGGDQHIYYITTEKQVTDKTIIPEVLMIFDDVGPATDASSSLPSLPSSPSSPSSFAATTFKTNTSG
mmetsp:Transcript_24833/g.58946  ORF Transcript_24833/g.58946 Transcript_24833/m.58946 type:complete len:80 (-) Transcript_24833:2591-2830(-)